jgi:Flp pilus assembly protein TadD
MPDDVLKAIAAVEEALSIDQAFTEAWILDANASNVAQFFDPRNAAEHRARGEHAARRAVELDPESGGAYAALGFALWMKKDWRGSEEAFRKAASLNALPDVSSYCILQLAAGKFAAARDLIEEGRALQPQNPTVHRFLMFAYAALGEWATATGLYESGTELFGPSWREGPATWMHWLVGNGDLAKARAIPVEDDLNHAMLESLDAPDEALAQLHRTHDTTGAGNPNRRLYISLWAGHFGDNALAFEAARAAIDEQGGLIVYVWLPQLAPMRRMPEFKAYLREIGMVDYWHEYGWPDICRERGGDDFECD